MDNMLDSVCLVTVSRVEDQNISSSSTSYGTGFFVHNAGVYSYVVTCAHVIKDAYEEKQKYKVSIDEHTGEIEIYDEDTDIAVVRVNISKKISVLRLVSVTQEGEKIQVIGMSSLSKHRQKRDIIPLDGDLSKKTAWTISGKEKVSTWYLKLNNTDFRLQTGYSGAPVINKKNGCVVGIVSHKVPDGYAGIAVSAAMLKRIWKSLPEEIFINDFQFSDERVNTVSNHSATGQFMKYYQEQINGKHKQLSKNGEKRDKLEKARITEGSEKNKIDLDEEIEKCDELEKKLFEQIEEFAKKIDALS